MTDQINDCQDEQPPMSPPVADDQIKHQIKRDTGAPLIYPTSGDTRPVRVMILKRDTKYEYTGYGRNGVQRFEISSNIPLDTEYLFKGLEKEL